MKSSDKSRSMDKIKIYESTSGTTVNTLYEQAIHMRKNNNSSIFISIKLTEKKGHLAPYLIDPVKGTFGLCGSSLSESNYLSVNIFVIEHTERMHGAMLMLMKHHKSLVIKTIISFFMNFYN